MKGMFAFCDNLKIVNNIPNNVQVMTNTFRNCSSLESVSNLPKDLVDMEKTFYNCTSLVEVPQVPEGVVNMASTFKNCEKLNPTNALVIPECVKNMMETFRGCKAMVSTPIISPNTRVYNLYYTFYNCKAMLKLPILPYSVIAMVRTFNGCVGATGIIDNNPHIIGNYSKFTITENGIVRAGVTPNIPEVNIIDTLPSWAALSLVDSYRGTKVLNADIYLDTTSGFLKFKEPYSVVVHNSYGYGVIGQSHDYCSEVCNKDGTSIFSYKMYDSKSAVGIFWESALDTSGVVQGNGIKLHSNDGVVLSDIKDNYVSTTSNGGTGNTVIQTFETTVGDIESINVVYSPPNNENKDTDVELSFNLSARIANKVSFYDEGNTLIEDVRVPVGEKVVAISSPSKSDVDTGHSIKSYEFDKWVFKSDVDTAFDFNTVVVSDVELLATYTESEDFNEYTVTFYDEDKVTVLDTKVVEWGSAVSTNVVPSKNGSTTDTEIKSYSFNKWVDINGNNVDLSSVVGDLDVYASYTENVVTVVSVVLDRVVIVTPPDKVNYKEKETFDKTGMTVDAVYIKTWSDGHTEEIIKNNVSYMVDESTPLTEIVTYVVVSVTDGGITKSANQPINVNAFIESEILDSISIVAPPVKVDYKEKETFNKTGMVVDAIYKQTWSNGNITYKTVNDVIYNVDETSLLTENDTFREVSVSDNGVVKYAKQPITVVAFIESEVLDSISIVNPPVKVLYKEKETFDKSGMVVDAIYKQVWSNGNITYKTVNDVNYTVDESTLLNENINFVEVSFTDGVTKVARQPITVVAFIESSVLDSISIVTPPNKVVYKEKETFDKTGMVVDAIYKETWSNGNITYSTVNDVNYIVDESTILTEDVVDVVVSFTDAGVTKEAKQPISVNAFIESEVLDSISIVNPPNKVEYKEKETFDKTGMVVDAIYKQLWSNGNITYKTVSGVNFIVDESTLLRESITSVEVSFTDTGVTKFATQRIRVNAFIESEVLDKVTIITPPNKVNYLYSEVFNRTGMIVDAIYKQFWSNGNITYRVVNDSQYDVDESTPLVDTDTNRVVSVTDNGVTKSDLQDITVRDYIERTTFDRIVIASEPNKVRYLEGELFDKTGMVVNAVYTDYYKSGKTVIRTVNDVDYVYDKTNKLVEADTRVVVSVTDLGVTRSADVSIEVSPYVTSRVLDSIKIVKAPDKVDYLEGECFIKTGMVVDAKYLLTWSNGNTTYEDVSNVAYTVDEVSKLRVEDSYVVVSFEDTGVVKTANQPISVSAYIVSEVLDSITIVQEPNKVEYLEGECFVREGMIVDAKYLQTWSNGNVTYKIVNNVDYVVDETKKLRESDTYVVVSYTDGVTKTANQPITVDAYIVSEVLDRIDIVVPPNKVEYLEGECFVKEGMIVDAVYLQTWSNGDITYKTVNNVDYTVDEDTELKLEDTFVVVSYTDGVTKTAEQAITVSEVVDDKPDEDTPDEPTDRFVTVKGTLKYTDGTPVANKRIELHSDVKVAYTDENGSYEFTEVEVGEHKLTIFYDNGNAMAEVTLNVAKANEGEDKANVSSSADECTVSTSISEDIFTVNADISQGVEESAPDTGDMNNISYAMLLMLLSLVTGMLVSRKKIFN